MKPSTSLIGQNSSARHNYFIESQVESGIVLEGWEVKSLRQNRLNLKHAHASVLQDEIWLLGAHISPLPNCDANNRMIDPLRTRKLLLSKKEISRLIGATQRKGYTLIPLKAYWKNQRVKVALGLGKGKHARDKRIDQKNRDWQRKKSTILKKNQNE